MDLIHEAKTFAIAAHESIGQKRKYTGEAYWKHPEEVARIVSMVTSDPEMIAAAWLHDTVEDTPVTIEDILAKFGPVVAGYVTDLTDVDDGVPGNRAYRKGLNRAHAATICANAKTVKLADIISNTQSISEYAPKFAKVYLPEMRLLLGVIKEGSAALWGYALNCIEQGEKKIAEEEA